MSLLMDALKRAEKARQAEAAKEADGDEAPDSRELSLDPLDDRAEPERAPVASPPKPAPPAPAPAPSKEDSGELNFSLEDTGASEADSTPVAPLPSKSSATTEHLGPFSLIDEDAISTEDTGEMQPIARDAEEAVKEYFDETSSMAIALDDIQQVINEDTLAGTQPVTADELARQTAHKVFDAKVPPTRRRGRAALIAVPLILVVFLGVSGFLLWDDLVKTFVGPPPIVPRQPPPVAVVEPATAGDAAQPQSSETVVTQPESSETMVAQTQAPAQDMTAGSDSAPATTATAESGGQSELAAKLSAAADAAAADSGDKVDKTAEKPSGSEGAAKPAVSIVTESEPQIAAADSEKIAALTAQALTGTVGTGSTVSATSLKISRTAKPDRIHPTLQSAYDALQRGENARARALYEEALGQDPKNRNALLGIGAIATRAGDVQAARQTYARLLTLYPRDPVARAALIDSYQDVSAVEGEGHIKRLLAENSNQPFLYATLGNLYARQGRWPEAQQAYFDAYRLDSVNADYAFNLAVSLDRIGQRAAALSYYRRALELAEGGQASFDAQAVLKRISSLGPAGSG